MLKTANLDSMKLNDILKDIEKDRNFLKNINENRCTRISQFTKTNESTHKQTDIQHNYYLFFIIWEIVHRGWMPQG